ncbi:hypothetical protein CLU79DRAFT_729592 [Phycomyces nitens]|nr:hypothetical protein CLU79DRAFT_729592 [Phycomyces nitens]
MSNHEGTSDQYPLDIARINAIARMNPDEFAKTMKISCAFGSIKDLPPLNELLGTNLSSNLPIQTPNSLVQTQPDPKPLTQSNASQSTTTNITTSGRSFRKRSNIQKHPYTVDSARYNSIVDKIISTATRAEEERRVLQSYEHIPKRQRTKESRYEGYYSSGEDFNYVDDGNDMEEDEEAQSSAEDLCSEYDTIEDTMDSNVSQEFNRAPSEEVQTNLDQEFNDEFSFEQSLKESQRLFLPPRSIPTSKTQHRPLVTYQRKNKKGLHSNKTKPSASTLSSLVSQPKVASKPSYRSSQSFDPSQNYGSPIDNWESNDAGSISTHKISEAAEVNLQEDDEMHDSYGQLQLNYTRRKKNRYLALEDSDEESELESSVEDIFEFPDNYEAFTKRHSSRKEPKDSEIYVSSQESREPSPEPVRKYPGKASNVAAEGSTSSLNKAAKSKYRSLERKISPEDSFIVPDEQYTVTQRVKLPTIDDLQNNKKFIRGVLPMSFQKVYSNELRKEKHLQKSLGNQRVATKSKRTQKKPARTDKKSIQTYYSDEDMADTEDSVRSDLPKNPVNESGTSTLSFQRDVVQIYSDSEDELPSTRNHNAERMNSLPLSSRIERDIRSSYVSNSESRPQSSRRKNPKPKKKTIPYVKPVEVLPSENTQPYRRIREPTPRYNRISINFKIEPFKEHSCLESTVFLKRRTLASMPNDEMDIDDPYNWVCLPRIPSATFGKDTGGEQTIEDALSIVQTLFWECFKHMSSPWHRNGVFNEEETMPKCIEFFKYVTFCLTRWIPSLQTNEEREISARFFRKNIEALTSRIMKLSGNDFYADNIRIDQVIRDSGVWKQLVVLLLFTLDWLLCLEELDPQEPEESDDPLNVLDKLIVLTLQDDSNGINTTSKDEFKSFLYRDYTSSNPTRERVIHQVDGRFGVDKMINHLLRVLMALGHDHAKFTVRDSLLYPHTPIITEAWINLINLLRTRLDSNVHVEPNSPAKSTLYFCQVLIDHLKAEDSDFDLSVWDKGEEIWNWLYTLQVLHGFDQEGQYTSTCAESFGHWSLVGNILSLVCGFPDEDHPRSSRKITICSTFDDYWETFLYRCRNFLGVDQG